MARTMAPPEGEFDKIHLTALQLPHGVLAPDIWGGPGLKPTPATISIEMTLRPPGFQSAAQGDALDRSTLHYGHLAKKLLEKLETARGVEEVLNIGFQVLDGMNGVPSLQPNGSTQTGPLDRARVSVEVEKGGMFAESVQVYCDEVFPDHAARERRGYGLHIRDVSMKILIGVNDYERQKPQLVYGSMEVYYGLLGGKRPEGDFVRKLFGLERKLLESAEHTSFETLESLAEDAIHQLGRCSPIAVCPGAWVKLRLAKPRAVAFAKAPAIEVCRDFSMGASNWGNERREGSIPKKLVVIKPYAL